MSNANDFMQKFMDNIKHKTLLDNNDFIMDIIHKILKRNCVKE